MSEKSARPLSKSLAQTSWTAPLLMIVMTVVARNVSGVDDLVKDFVLTVVGSGLYLIGLICGVFALLGIRRHGREGILVPAVIGSLLSASLLVAVASNFWGSYQRATSPQAQIERAADLLRQELPRPVDDETSLDSVRAEEGQLIYGYTLVRYTSEQLDGAAFGETIKPQLEDEWCEPMREILEAGFSIKAVYSGSDGAVLSEVELVGADCGLFVKGEVNDPSR